MIRFEGNTTGFQNNWGKKNKDRVPVLVMDTIFFMLCVWQSQATTYTNQFIYFIAVSNISSM